VKGYKNEIKKQVLKSFKLKPTDDLIRKLGESNLGFIEALWEFLNNAIQKALDNGSNFFCDIEFEWDDKDKSLLRKISIQDRSGGIDIDDIHNCLNPGYKKEKEEITLSEHGMGLNVALEKLIAEAQRYRLTSYHKNQCYYVDDLVSWNRACEVKEADREENHDGLKIEFFNLNNNFGFDMPANASAKFHQFWADTCAKYRYMHKKFTQTGRSFNINFIATCGDKQQTRIYTPVSPVLINPLDGKNSWITEFVLSDDLGNKIKYSLGSCNVDRESYSIPAGEYRIWYHIHPYRITDKNFGFDTIYKDVVIKFLSTDEVMKQASATGAKWALYSGLRGEKRILEGGKSVFTKNGLVDDPAIRKLDERATNIFIGKEPHPKTGLKLNYIETYVHRRNTSASNCAPEIIVKHRHRIVLEGLQQLEVTQEETTKFGRIDMVVGNRILEHKIKKSTADDALQVFKYLRAKPDKTIGELWAPEHTDGAKEMVKLINVLLATVNQEIVLKVLLDQWKNPNLNDKEKAILNNGAAIN